MEKNFSETLKQLRIDAGYSQKQVYEMLGIRQSTFSAWETGRAEPSADMLLKLCKLYKVNDIFSAFGYDGFNGDGSICLNMNEIDMVEKYRLLDDHGKEMIDFTLEKEYERSKALVDQTPDNIVKMPAHLEVNAAHHSKGEFTDEERQADEDMLD